MKIKTETIQSTLDGAYILHEVCTTQKAKAYVLTYEEKEVRIKTTDEHNKTKFTPEVMTARLANNLVKKYNTLFMTDKFGKREI